MNKRSLVSSACATAVVSILIANKALCADPYVEGEAIVSFKPATAKTATSRILSNHASKLSRRFDYFSQLQNKEIGVVHSDRTTAELISELQSDPDIESVEPNYIRRIQVRQPNDTFFGSLWGLSNTGQSINGTAGTTGADVKFSAAWSMIKPGTNTPVVAVVDSGVDYTHPDLAANIWTNTSESASSGKDQDGNGYVNDIHGWNFADNNNDPSDSGLHGTHVAGTIAAVGNNGVGVIGVCSRARILPLRISSDGETMPTSAIIEAIQYATMMKNRGVNIVAINASFGGESPSTTEQQVIQAAGNAGIIFCAASGNNTNNLNSTPFYPASYRLSNMIVVGASDNSDNLTSFSNYGNKKVDLVAPGKDILSTIPLSQAGTVASVTIGSSVYSANSMTFSGVTTEGAGITGKIIYCGLGDTGEFPSDVQGNIALISRGTLNFSVKAQNAMDAGALAVIIYNNASGNFLGTLGASDSWVPVISISMEDGLAIKNSLPQTGTLDNYVDATQIYAYLDGTSMATPHVCGAVAFAAINFPNETVTARIKRILSNVDVFSGLSSTIITSGRLNLLRTVDTDRNGLPDWWEQSYFKVTNGVDASADPDKDGMNNLAEWLAGTDPLDATSNLKLSATISNKQVILSWPSADGRYYRLERGGNVTAFSAVQTNLPATAPSNTITETLSTNGGTFYRVMLEQ